MSDSDIIKTMVLIQPTPDYVTAVEQDLPDGFYTPNSLWRVSYTVGGKLAAGTRVHRRLQIGDLAVSNLSGDFRYPEVGLFRDTVDFPMYIDGLFDVQSTGFNSISPVTMLEPGKDIRTPLSASGETVLSYYDSPLVDRFAPIRLKIWAEPIFGTVSLFVNGFTVIQVV